MRSSLALLPLSMSIAQEIDVPFEKYELANGLQVVLHEDPSSPVVSVYVSYHVGSGREEPGRSGFAHLFEHMLFQGSQNVGDDQHFKLISEAGGTLNGTTNTDRTLYFETLPSNQLELALWLEADRMGFLLPAVTQAKLDNQREVVKNERRQNYENRPYGRAWGALAAAMYPPEHPYSWLTIGSHEDLSAASLEDVHSFFRRWYGPQNATLAIGGAFDPAEARAWVEKWFGPIPPGPAVPPMEPWPARLEADRRVVVEDEVQLPRLIVSWPGVPQSTEHEAALDALGILLAGTKSSILERALTIDRVLAKDVSARNDSAEIAGTFDVTITAAPGVGLDEIEGEMRRLLRELSESGVDPDQLQRARNRYEASFVRELETVAARTSRLATSNTFTGDPASFLADFERRLAVTGEEVLAVLERYVLDRPAVVLSVVPAGHRDLAATGRSPEQIAAERKLSRSEPPAAGDAPAFRSPPVWHATLANGVPVTGTGGSGLPLTQIRVSVPGGHLRETPRTLGLSSLVAEMMEEGTKELTNLELADELDFLGARMSVDSRDDEITIYVDALDRHLDRTLELLTDVLLTPRFDAGDFARVKEQRLTDIDSRVDNIRTIAEIAWSRILWGDGVAGMPSSGTRPSVESLTLDDVREFHARSVTPEGARIVAVSGLAAEELGRRLEPLVQRWQPRGAEPIEASAAVGDPPAIERTRIFVVDKPGAPQSEIRIGHPSISSAHPDWYPLTVLNYVLGGAFSSRINLNLREDKGYTYGARSRFSEGLHATPFTASAGVRTDVTAESVVEFMKELRAILDGVTEQELAFAKNALHQALLREYESNRSRLSFVDDISRYGWPDDYPTQRLAELQSLTTEQLRSLAEKHLFPERASILVVGDRATVAEELTNLGYGDVSELAVDGAPLIDAPLDPGSDG